MKYFVFSRIITRREAIDKYGKLGFTEHKECVILKANTIEEAKELIKPFNHKKHIKFIHDPVMDIDTRTEAVDTELTDKQTNQIIDLGIV